MGALIPFLPLATWRDLPWWVWALVLGAVSLGLLAWWRPDWACLAVATILGGAGAWVARRRVPPEDPTDDAAAVVARVPGAVERVREAGAASRHPQGPDAPQDPLEAMREALDAAGVRRGDE